MRRNQQISPTEASASSPITAANYTSRAMDFMRAKGGFGFVVRWKHREGEQTPAQWKAWLDYFEQIRLPTAWLRKQTIFAVPCEWPEDFDLNASLSDKGWAPPLARDEFDPVHQAAMRQRVGKLFRELARSISSALDPHARKRPPSRAEALAALSEGFPAMKAPLPVSEALRASNAARGMGEVA